MQPRFTHNLKRLGRISLQNLGRNLFLSVATSIMMGLILFIFNVVMVLNILTESSIDKLGQKVDLIIYISDEAGTYEVTQILNNLKALPVVKDAEYTNKETALAEFLQSYPEKSDPFTEYGLDNPLPSNIRIVTEQPADQQIVLEYIKNSSYKNYFLDIESSKENQEIVNKLVSLTNFAKKLILGVIVTFVFGSLLIIINAIHLSIFTRKTEIQIMQLVGAKPYMIMTPFIFEGAIYSIIAVLFSTALLFLFLVGSNLTNIVNFNESFNPFILFGLEFLGSLIIGIASSGIALNYYLKRNFILE